MTREICRRTGESGMGTHMNVAVVTPMEEELEAVRNPLLDAGYGAQYGSIGRLSVTRFPELGMALAVGGVGKAQFGVHVQHLLDSRSEWDLVVCAGAAGALSDEVSVGDVVVGTRTVEHDYTGRFEGCPMPTFDGDSEAIEGLRGVSESSEGYSVFFGGVASGDEDIVDSVRRGELHDRTNALAVAWEGAGGARACRFSEVSYVEVRGITDGADRDAPGDFEANLRLAMGNVADLLVRWLT
jgi:adenosylhomocysteine nucleosidase